MEERTRVVASVALVVVGILLGVSAGLLTSSASTAQAQGTVIDFSQYDTVWTDAEVSEFDTTLGLLEYACGANGYDLVVDWTTGDVLEINGVGGAGAWALWAVEPGSTEWTELPAPYDQDPSDYTITSWTYSEDGREPTVAVDSSGNPAYGYSRKYRVVSLSPTVTELICSLGANYALVGVDMYSDYPASVTAGVDDGSITVVGSYTSPSLELVLGTNPDLVVCDGSQSSHVQFADTMRSLGIDAVVTYPGEDVDQVLDNVYLIGEAMGYDIAARNVIDDTRYVMDSLSAVIGDGGAATVKAMVTLEPDVSPWVSGSDTYINGLLVTMRAENVFSNWGGWVHITSDRIPYANPDVIIIVTTEYAATQAEYDYLYGHLSEQWKITDAWKNGRVYVICESAAEMVQRCGPRIGQTAELLAMMLHPECFDDVPKIVGDDYTEYLRYSRDMGYNVRGRG